MKQIILAGGCFWGVEEYFSRIPGVQETCVGYANGSVENPSYELVCTGTTHHAEAVKVTFDASKLSLEDLLKAYWAIIDPTILNKQGPDVGLQYRTGIYYIDDKDLQTIRKSLDSEQKKYQKAIVTEILPLDNFSEAEEEHQDYLKKHPDGYCHIPLDKFS